eukprot:11733135-Prorocentrum_lima.AAC.1
MPASAMGTCCQNEQSVSPSCGRGAHARGHAGGKKAAFGGLECVAGITQALHERRPVLRQ